MNIREKWEQVDIAAFAKAWLEEERTGESETDDSLSMKATLMSFTASPEVQWNFILAAVEHASNDEELGMIAAGAFESLMGKSGSGYIDRLEQHCRKNPKCARMTTGAWQHTMDDDVWKRVQAIQKTAS